MDKNLILSDTRGLSSKVIGVIVKVKYEDGGLHGDLSRMYNLSQEPITKNKVCQRGEEPDKAKRSNKAND